MWILCILLAYIHFYLLYYLSTIYLFLKRVGLVQTSMYQLVTYIMSRQCGEIKTEKGLLTTLKLMLIVNTVFYVYLNSFFVHALPIIRMVDVCTWFKGNNNIWQINSWLNWRNLTFPPQSLNKQTLYTTKYTLYGISIH